MYLVMLALHDSEKLQDLLTAWEEAGVSGATVLPSTGLGRIRRQQALREDLPLMPTLDNLFARVENLSHTILSVVDNDRMVDSLISAAERVVGDLRKPDTGILVVIPVLRAYGVEKEAQVQEVVR